MNISDIMATSAAASSPMTTPGDSNITLWQFLLELLVSEKHNDIIQWTRCADGEFKLLDAEAVARLWGVRKHKPNMNYDKLSRALRYYYEKNIIKKVVGQKFVYRFVAPTESHHSSFDFGKVKEESSSEAGSFVSNSPNSMNVPVCSASNFSALSLANAGSPRSTVHSISTPSPSNSTCSPSSSIASNSSASLMTGANHSTSPAPSTSSPTTQDEQKSATRKRQNSTNNADHPPPRRTKPNPLNLSATSNFLNSAAQFSPMLLFHQNSPHFQPAINQLYALASASLASAGMYGPQMSPLLAAQSPFRSPLATPKGNGVSTPTTQPQVFQFPPTSSFGTSLINPFSALISPSLPFMLQSPSSTQFKFPSSEALKTPTVPLKTRST
ncbi:unnamed protein product [Caenorhabditis bovis]|uniref:ETS domain-containing protein n=1 Tax=Caenorhabditis bovis TaxID=2654633 RepID=A0A8S1F7Q6_9PELO|nr:unnamed protein product [Caenorhabditis bovis]